MARMRFDVSHRDVTDRIARNIETAMKTAMTDVVFDLKRTASMAAPHDTGYLERSAQHTVRVTPESISGTVGFSAVEKGFNYAQWTHDKTYNLGEKSERKQGGNSVFGSGTVPVGTGYLKNALENNREGYMKYLADAYKEAVK